MELSWLSLLPPVITLTLAFTTRRIVSSLLCGIGISAFIATEFAPYTAIKLTVFRMITTSEISNLSSLESFCKSESLFMFLFLIFLGIIITLVGHSGGATAYGNFCKEKLLKHTNADQKVQTSSLFLSSLLALDDYFSSFTVGSVMQPLTDTYKIPRIKLAFLIDSMAAPLCALFPLSSWGAAIVTQLGQSGINETIQKTTIISNSPLMVYLTSIPFIFHSFFIMISAFFIIKMKISFGPMHQHEQIAKQTGNLFAGKEGIAQRVRNATEENKKNASLFDFVFPIITLFILVIAAILYTGNWNGFGGENNLFNACIKAPPMLGLFIGSGITLIATLILFLGKQKVTIYELPSIFKDGSKLMLSTIMMLILAWTLGSFMRTDLLTGAYLASIMPTNMPVELLPVLFSLLSALTSFSIGSAFGTMAIMFPIAVPMLLSLLNTTIPIDAIQIPMLFPLLGGIVSGSVLGDHISPIADVTLLASSSAGAYHLDYIYAQFYYAIPVGCGTTLAFLLAGFTNHIGLWYSLIISFSLGLATALSILWYLNKKRITQEKRP